MTALSPRCAPSARPSSALASRTCASSSRGRPRAAHPPAPRGARCPGPRPAPAVLPVGPVGLPVRRAGDRHSLLPGGSRRSTPSRRELGGGAETEREILMYLRHEAGHCFNYAYRLYETDEWRKLFGDYSKPYKEDYKPQPVLAQVRGAHLRAGTRRSTRTRTSPRPSRSGSPRQRLAAAVQGLGRAEEAPVRGAPSPASWADARRSVAAATSATSTSTRWRRRSLDHYRQRDLDEKVDLADRRAARLRICSSSSSRPGGAPAGARDADARRAADADPGGDPVLGREPRRWCARVVDHLLERTTALKLTVHARQDARVPRRSSPRW